MISRRPHFKPRSRRSIFFSGISSARFILALTAFISVVDALLSPLSFAKNVPIANEVVDAEIDIDTIRDFAESGSQIDLRGINGGRPNDQIFIHTFTHLQSDNPNEAICGAKLATHLVPSADQLTYTDTLGMRFYKAGSYHAIEAWGHMLSGSFSGGGSTDWWDLKHFPTGHAHQLNFARLPIEHSEAKINIVSMLASCDRFAFYVEDDTYVRSLALKLDYCVDGQKTRSRIIRVRPPKEYEDPTARPVEIDETNPVEVVRATVSANGLSSNEWANRISGTSSSVKSGGISARADVTIAQLKDNGGERQVRAIGEYGLVNDRSIGLFDLSYHDNRYLVGGLFSSTPAYTTLQARAGIEAAPTSGLHYALFAIPAQLVYENRGFEGTRGSGLQSLQHGLGVEAAYPIRPWFSVYGGASATTSFGPIAQHAYFLGPINSAPILYTSDGRPYFLQTQLGFNLALTENISIDGAVSYDRLGVNGKQNGKTVNASSSQTQVRVGTSIRLK